MITITQPNLKLGLMDLKDQGTLAIVDLSSYLLVPISSHLSMQITAPGYDTVNVVFTPNNVNIYKCTDLGITCGPTECCPLPDGIYSVTYTVDTTTTPTSLQKTFIKIDQIKCKFQNMFSKVDLECDCGTDKQKEYKRELKGVDLLIVGAVAAANTCDDLLAYKLYQKADSILNNICCQFGLSCVEAFSCPQCQ